MRWRIALAVYWLVLFGATHYPRVPMPQDVPHSDKLVHFAAFGLLAALFWLATRRVWLAAAVLVPYAIVDEFTQQYVGRYTDLADAIANVTGIAVVLAVIALQQHRRRARLARHDKEDLARRKTPDAVARKL